MSGYFFIRLGSFFRSSSRIRRTIGPHFPQDAERERGAIMPRPSKFTENEEVQKTMAKIVQLI